MTGVRPAAMVLALLGGACGAETIELAPTGDAAAVPVAEGGGPEATSGEGATLAVDGAVAVCEAGAPAPACRALGDPCGGASDCCSAHCASSTCVAPGTCAGAGASCSSRADCCSGLCEPVAGTTARACLAECRPPGASCQRASDCCSLACTGGVCGGSECMVEGSDCTSNAQCCSNRCDAASGNRCTLDSVAACRPAGEDCTSGGGGPCCGACNDTVKRCDPGPGPCRPRSAVCRTSADCCNGTCADDGTGHTVCVSALLPDGAVCAAGFECASGACGGNPPRCAAAMAPCGVTGASCTAAAQCCSGTCTGGACQPGCALPAAM